MKHLYRLACHVDYGCNKCGNVFEEVRRQNPNGIAVFARRNIQQNELLKLKTWKPAFICHFCQKTAIESTVRAPLKAAVRLVKAGTSSSPAIASQRSSWTVPPTPVNSPAEGASVRGLKLIKDTCQSVNPVNQSMHIIVPQKVRLIASMLITGVHRSRRMAPQGCMGVFSTLLSSSNHCSRLWISVSMASISLFAKRGQESARFITDVSWSFHGTRACEVRAQQRIRCI